MRFATIFSIAWWKSGLVGGDGVASPCFGWGVMGMILPSKEVGPTKLVKFMYGIKIGRTKDEKALVRSMLREIKLRGSIGSRA